MQPLISVCIPTYNSAKYFRECLDSILAQTFTDFELLIVDDHSSDETLSISQEYADRDSRVRITQNERNLGLVGNWNRCIELARGEWIKFVFQDDLIAPTCLEKMLAETHANSAIVFCRRDFIFEDGTPNKIRRNYKKISSLEKYLPSKARISAQKYCQLTIKFLGINFVGEPTVVMVRKSAFQQFGSFNPHMVQLCDFEMWTRIAINSDIIHVPEVLASFRVHAGATTAKNHREYEFSIGLDKIIMLHEFAFHPQYENIRAVCKRWWKPVNLIALMRQSTYFAWISASRAEGNNSPENARIVRSWEQLLAAYPNLKMAMQLPLLEKIHYLILRRWIHTKWQLEQFYESQLQA